MNKLTELQNIAIQTNVAVITISETWLDNSIISSEVAIEGYNLIRCDRDRQGGGVCAYIRNDIAFKERFDLDNASLECLWFEILLPKTKPIVLGACYRPPKQTNF